MTGNPSRYPEFAPNERLPGTAAPDDDHALRLVQPLSQRRRVPHIVGSERPPRGTRPPGASACGRLRPSWIARSSLVDVGRSRLGERSVPTGFLPLELGEIMPETAFNRCRPTLFGGSGLQ